MQLRCLDTTPAAFDAFFHLVISYQGILRDFEDPLSEVDVSVRNAEEKRFNRRVIEVIEVACLRCLDYWVVVYATRVKNYLNNTSKDHSTSTPHR